MVSAVVSARAISSLPAMRSINAFIALPLPLMHAPETPKGPVLKLGGVLSQRRGLNRVQF
ncbi:unannotated protein [freshwater metagenome]|uniref:Unannotated protein n=1 Tax=freshwater metagenome TaxID=449393 RepID=A0A6J7PDZ0_9ZZZZ